MDTYKTDLLDLRHCDCMDLMRGLPDKAFALAIVDPPYGKKPSRGGRGACERTFTQRDNEWDVAPNKDYFQELSRVSDNQIVWGANYFTSNLPPSNCWVVWDKHTQDSVLADVELAYTSFKTVSRKLDFAWNGMIQGDMKNKEQRIHPTQKPVALYRWLLANYAKDGDTILDTHLGSMSSAIAAHYAGFHLTGCELDADYFAAGVERVKRETAQMTLGI